MLLRADGLEVEYQVPTSSQRDQEDDGILVDSEDDEEDDDEEGLPDDGVSSSNVFHILFHTLSFISSQFYKMIQYLPYIASRGIETEKTFC